MAVPEMPAVAWAVWWQARAELRPPNRAPSIHLLPLRGRARLDRKSLGCG